LSTFYAFAQHDQNLWFAMAKNEDGYPYCTVPVGFRQPYRV